MDVAIGEFLNALRPGITEAELLGIIMGSLFRQGVQNSFGTVPPVMVSGEKTRYKSVPPSLRKIRPGDLVFFDLEPELEGYYLDIARPVVFGRASAKIQKIIETSQATEQAVFEAIKPGVCMRSLQEEAFKVVRKAGLEKFYYFKFHGQGTMRPAYPFPNQLDFVLDTGMVFTVESILVDPELTTGTIENAFLVTENGSERLVKGALGTSRT
jgi:Xaa-Pro aminopeptidase